TNDASAGDIQNYPLGDAESATALQEMSEALSFLNAVGETQYVTNSTSGNNSTLTHVLANIGQAVGGMSAGVMAEAIVQVRELAGLLASGEGGVPMGGVIMALANTLWTISSTAETITTLNDKENQAFNDDPDLVAALADPNQIGELVNDFVA